MCYIRPNVLKVSEVQHNGSRRNKHRNEHPWEFFNGLDQIDMAPTPISGEEIVKAAMMMTYDDPSQPMYVVEQEPHVAFNFFF